MIFGPCLFKDPYNNISCLIEQHSVYVRRSIKNLDLFLDNNKKTRTKRNKETLGSVGYICYLHGGDVFTGVRVCPNSSNCTH